jgi:hypothetical protein
VLLLKKDPNVFLFSITANEEKISGKGRRLFWTPSPPGGSSDVSDVGIFAFNLLSMIYENDRSFKQI